jgi:hypothetical protein
MERRQTILYKINYLSINYVIIHQNIEDCKDYEVYEASWREDKQYNTHYPRGYLF